MAAGTSWLSSLGSWLSSGKNLEGLGSVLGAGGSIYGGIKQAEAAQGMIDLNNKQYEFNKNQLLANAADKESERKAYNSVFGKKNTGVVAL